tara:strand:+ start:965 stop:1246 length:282 start_codon:yes stop_codon:yes gene_type:complete
MRWCVIYILLFSGVGRYRGPLCRFSVLHDALCSSPCRTATYTGRVLSTLAKLFKQIALFICCHIPPGCNFSSGAMTAKTIAAFQINLTDRNAW